MFVPEDKKARRRETFSREEFQKVRKAAHAYPAFDSPDRKSYVRTCALNKGRDKQAPSKIKPDLELSRRVLLRYFIEVAAFSGARPHELAEREESALRWQDVAFQEVEVRSTELNKTATAHEVAVLHNREDTDDVFADQTGTNAGNPVDLDALRQHWRELLDHRVKFKRFKADLYH